MALKHALLGLIARFGPITGYRLHKKIVEPRRPSLPQVYRSLRDMAEDKLVESERVHGQKEPSKNLFVITPAGLAELQRWLESPDREEPIEEPLMPKLWFASFSGKETIIKHLKAFAEYRKIENIFYQGQKKRWISSKRENINPVDKVYWRIIFDYIIAKAETDLAWAESTIKKLLSTNFDTLKDISPDDGSDGGVKAKGASKRPTKLK